MYEALQRLRFKSFCDSVGGEIMLKIQNVFSSLDFQNYSGVPMDFDKIMNSYSAFVETESEKNPTFSFWSTYIDMVQLLLLYIKATRTSDWDLHLQTVRLMLPWFFVTDRTNYSRYLPCYLLEMLNLSKTHPCK